MVQSGDELPVSERVRLSGKRPKLKSSLVEEERSGGHEVKSSREEQRVRREEKGVERKGGTALSRQAGCVGSRCPRQTAASCPWSPAIPSSHC